jgi:hypothetical protein
LSIYLFIYLLYKNFLLVATNGVQRLIANETDKFRLKPFALCYRTWTEGFCFPSRRRISSVEIPPSTFCFARDRSIRARNFGLLLSETVSMSALLILTSAATGFPSRVIITGSFFTFIAVVFPLCPIQSSAALLLESENVLQCLASIQYDISNYISFPLKKRLLFGPCTLTCRVLEKGEVFGCQPQAFCYLPLGAK